MDDLTRQIQDLVDRYGAQDMEDLPGPELEELAANRHQAFAADNPCQTIADYLDGATDPSIRCLSTQIERVLRFGDMPQTELEIGRAIVSLARQWHHSSLKRLVEQAAATSKDRQGRQAADNEADNRAKEARHG